MEQQLSLDLQFSIASMDAGQVGNLRGIVADVSEALRKNENLFKDNINFLTKELVTILKIPVQLTDAEGYPINQNTFQLYYINNAPFDQRSSPIPQMKKTGVIQQISDTLRAKDIIGTDESNVDALVSLGSHAFLKSVAFHLSDETVGPILVRMRSGTFDENVFKRANELIGYIRNIYVALVAIENSLQYGRQPYVVLHGPLVRAIGAFADIIFGDFDFVRELVSINPNTGEGVGELRIPANPNAELYSLINGEIILKEFDGFCRKLAAQGGCNKQCQNKTAQGYPLNNEEPIFGEDENAKLKQRKFPGLCLYFYLLRKLYEKCQKHKILLASCVENIENAREFTRIVFPSIMFPTKSNQRHCFTNLLKSHKLILPFNDKQQQPEFIKKMQDVIDELNLKDSNLFTHAMKEGCYTSPVEIFRYKEENEVRRKFGHSISGVHNRHWEIIKRIFPPEKNAVMMSYVRTTPLKEPLRVEFFNIYGDEYHQLLKTIYALTLPCQSYGMPVVLYYADLIARTPQRLINAVVEGEIIDLINRMGNVPFDTVMALLGKMNRNYLERKGVER